MEKKNLAKITTMATVGALTFTTVAAPVMATTNMQVETDQKAPATNLEEAKKNLEEAKAVYNKAVEIEKQALELNDSAQDDYTKAKKAAELAVEDAAKAVKDAEIALEKVKSDASSDVDKTKAKVTETKVALDDAKKAEDNAKNTYQKAKKLCAEKKSELDALKEKTTTSAQDVAEKKAKADKAAEVYNTKKKAAAEAKAKVNTLTNDVNSLKAEINNAEKKYEVALKEKKAASEAVKTAKAELKKSEETLHALQQEVENGSAEYKDAVKKVELAKSELAKAKDAALKASSGLGLAKKQHQTVKKRAEAAGVAVKDAENKVKACETAILIAEKKPELDALKNTEAEKQASYDKVKAEVADIEAIKVQKDAALKAAEDAEKKASEAFEIAYAAYEKALAVEGEASTTYHEAQKKSIIASDALSLAESNYSSLVQYLNNAEYEAYVAQEAVVAAQAEYDRVSNNAPDINALKAKGSFGFFEYVGASHALEAYEFAQGTKLKDTTKLGAANDATSLENMKASFDYMRTCNALRAKHNLKPLLVSDSLMAKSQLQLNWTAAQNNPDHSRVFNVGENIAWGLNKPFDVWYYHEKEIYDKNPTNPDGQVGHYLQIIDPYFTYTGFSVVTGNTYRIYQGQVFDVEIPADEPAYTVDEYEARFMSYYNDLKNGTLELPDQQQLIDQAANKLAAAEQRFEQAQRNLDELKKQEADAAKDVENKRAEHKVAYEEYVKAEEAYFVAVSDSHAKKENVENADKKGYEAHQVYLTAKKEAEQANKDYEPFREKVEQVTKELEIAKQACAAKQAEYDKLQNEYKVLTGSEFNGTSEDAVKQHNAAKQILTSKKIEKSAIELDLAEKQGAVNKAQAVYDAAFAIAAEKDTALKKAEENLKQLESTMQNNLAEQRKDVEAKTKTLADATALEEAKTKEVNEISSKIANLKSALAEEERKLEYAKKDEAEKQQAVADAEKSYKDAKSAYDKAAAEFKLLADAETEYNNAFAAETSIKKSYEDAQAKTVESEKTYTDVIKLLEIAQDKLRRAQELSFDKVKEQTIIDSDFKYLNDYGAKIKSADEAADDANSLLEEKAKALATVKDEYKRAKKEREVAEINLMLAQAEYDMFVAQQDTENPNSGNNNSNTNTENGNVGANTGKVDSNDKANDDTEKLPQTGDMNDVSSAAAVGIGAFGIMAAIKTLFRKKEE